MCRILSGNTAGDERNTNWKHVLKVHCNSSPLAKASRWNFVVIKHFARESLHVEPSCALDIVVYMLKCMFC